MTVSVSLGGSQVTIPDVVEEALMNYLLKQDWKEAVAMMQLMSTQTLIGSFELWLHGPTTISV